MKDISKTYEKHMEIENENEDVNINSIKGGVGEKINFADLENEQWFLSIRSFLDNKVSYIDIKHYWKKFQEAMHADDDLYRDAKEYRSHFRNWIKRQVSAKSENTGGIVKKENVKMFG